jgi:ribonuclease P protein component|tara:strand:+ start:287 stop:595 length:309 start_codon:yes stop_codon:yes gene_type:complete
LKLSLSSADFKSIMKVAKSLSCGDLSFKYAAGFDSGLGLIVSKKYGNAVQRNLFKRRCRSAFKTIIVKNVPNIALIIRPKKPNINNKSIYKSFTSIKEEIAN